MINADDIPAHTKEAIIRYVKYGLHPGGFLEAVICNDLKGAVTRADAWNQEKLVNIVAYFYNFCPSGCWGSRENMEAWMEQKTE